MVANGYRGAEWQNRPAPFFPSPPPRPNLRTSEPPNLRACATASLGVSDRVRFLGAGTRDDVLMLFRGADAVLVTSAWENLPHTVLEALAVGTPVVATAVGGVPEVVVDGVNGLLVPPHDVAAIAAAVERVVSEADLRRSLADAAPASVEELAEPRILRRIVEAITSG